MELRKIGNGGVQKPAFRSIAVVKIKFSSKFKTATLVFLSFLNEILEICKEKPNQLKEGNECTYNKKRKHAF